MWNVFENVWVLLSAAGITLVVVSMLRMDHPEWGYKPLLIPLAIAALAVGLDAGFKSDTEYIHYIIAESKKAAGANNVQGILKFISPDYSDRYHENKAELEVLMKHYLDKADIEKIKTQSHRITELNKTNAKSEMNIVVHLSSDSQYAAAGSLVFVGLQFEFEKIKKKWMINRVELVSVNNDPMSWNSIR